MVGVEDAVLVLHGVLLGNVVADESRVDGPIDDDVRHVDVPGPQFARHALGQRTQGVFGASKCGEVGGPAQPRGGAGEDDGAVSTGDHALGHLAAHQEAAETGHFPNLEILPGGFVQDAAGDVGTDVEHQDFDGGDVALDVIHQFDDLFFFACVGGKAVGPSAAGHNLRDEWLQLGRIAPRCARDQSLSGEALGDGATRGVARTNDQGGLLRCGFRTHLYLRLIE